MFALSSLLLALAAVARAMCTSTPSTSKNFFPLPAALSPPALMHSMDYLHSSDPFLGLDTSPLVHFEINFNDKKAFRHMDRFLSFLASPRGAEAREALRTVTVTGYDKTANWTLMSTVLGKTPNLVKLRWESTTIPSIVLRSLEEVHPDVQLFYTVSPCSWDRHEQNEDCFGAVGKSRPCRTSAMERESILGSTTLRSVTSTRDLALVHGILTTCPNVTELDLTVQRRGSCCVNMHRERPEGFDFSLSSPFFGKKMVSLESIKLDGYKLDYTLDGYRKPTITKHVLLWPLKILPQWMIRQFSLTTLSRWGFIRHFEEMQEPEEQELLTNLDGWLEHMDWSHVRTLDLARASAQAIRKLQPVLKNLSSLTVRHAGCEGEAAWHDLLDKTNSPMSFLSLKNLQRKDFDQTINVIVSRHGRTLTSLTLSDWEGFRSYHERVNETSTTVLKSHIYLTPSHLRTLAEGCPKLEHLDIDISRMSLTSLDNVVLDVLPSFPSLTTLVLRLESPDMQYRRTHPEQGWVTLDSHSVGPDRIVNGSSVGALFYNLRTQQQVRAQTETPLLKSLKVVNGGWSENYYDGMGSAARHLKGHWKCTINAEGKEVCTGKNTYSASFGYEWEEHIYDDHDDYDEE